MLSHPERSELIARYAAGYDVVIEALAGITDEEWDAREAPGEWSPRQVVHHLADSEMASALRLRQMLVSERAQIVPYDQDEYARVLYYDRPVAGSLAAFAGARAATVPILEQMTDEQWARSAHHPEQPDFGTESWLRYYAQHAHDHADQIRRARATVAGKMVTA
jgi:hypothetical protein